MMEPFSDLLILYARHDPGSCTGATLKPSTARTGLAAPRSLFLTCARTSRFSPGSNET